ncbi:conjugative transposon protein TraM [Pedobacter sp. HMWF019]|nr:conjugative transposon protein TraM [Pedobacter sp. HMWF019]
MKIIEKQPHSKAYLNHRKFLLVLPLLGLPFVTLGFYALDGGKGTGEPVNKKQNGMNMDLPKAENTADSTLDKMAFYDLARKDSIQKSKEDQSDPYYKLQTSLDGSFDSTVAPNSTTTAPPSSAFAQSLNGPSASNAYSGRSYNDPNERRVQEKLAALNASLNQATQPKSPSMEDAYRPRASSGTSTADIDRLESMIGSVQGGSGGGDPEMQQINSVLAQILDIQHPERVQERLKETSNKNKGQVYAVSSNVKPNLISTLDKPVKKSNTGNGFFSIDEVAGEDKTQNAIEAVVHEQQTITTGSIVKLRLTNDVYINGQLVPKNTFVFGTANVSGERLVIEVNNLRYGKSLFPVKLSVFDLDGLDGIYIPGAISRDVSKASADQALQSVTLGNTLDPSLGMQAMGAGLEAAKSLMSKKVKLIKVTVKAGYMVLLKDANQK